MPLSIKLSNTYDKNGMPLTGAIGLGTLDTIPLNLVPKPSARIYYFQNFNLVVLILYLK